MDPAGIRQRTPARPRVDYASRFVSEMNEKVNIYELLDVVYNAGLSAGLGE